MAAASPAHHPTATSDDAPRREVRRRTGGIPSTRAVAGGGLVALAAVATWWLASDAGEPPPPRYLVAARALGPGHRLEAGDLRAVAIALPRSTASHAYRSDRAPVGRRLARAVAADELLARDVVRSPATPPLLASIAVDPAWALDGQLGPGDRIDLLATVGEGPDASTVQVARGIAVSSVGGGSSASLGDTGSQVLTLAFTDPATLLASIDAARTGRVTIVRVTADHLTRRLAPHRTAGAQDPAPAAATTAEDGAP